MIRILAEGENELSAKSESSRMMLVKNFLNSWCYSCRDAVVDKPRKALRELMNL